MLITSIKPSNLLSFAEGQTPIELMPLNILVGPNGAGKSNLIECIRLLQTATQAKATPPLEWLWQGQHEQPVARLEAVINYPAGARNLRYWLEFTASEESFKLTDERVENEHPDAGHGKSYFYFAYQKGWPVTNVKSVRRQLKRDDIDTEISVLAQRKNPVAYPEISWLGLSFGHIRVYQDWVCGHLSPLRLAGKADLPDDFLAENFENLTNVLAKLWQVDESKATIFRYLKRMLPDLQDIEFSEADGRLCLHIKESSGLIPASRLSDGTLRYLCLLVILCHPSPPPLVCIEEPELGLHPEIMQAIAQLLREASARTQLIVTTHSDLLVEEFVSTPENVLAFAKDQGHSQLSRLDAKGLEDWLDQFTLGAELAAD